MITSSEVTCATNTRAAIYRCDRPIALSPQVRTHDFITASYDCSCAFDAGIFRPTQQGYKLNEASNPTTKPAWIASQRAAGAPVSCATYAAPPTLNHRYSHAGRNGPTDSQCEDNCPAKETVRTKEPVRQPRLCEFEGPARLLGKKLADHPAFLLQFFD